MQQELLNGVKGGSSVAQMRTAIWNRLVAHGVIGDPGVNR